MEKNNLKAWLYLLPALVFLGVFMVYPLIDVLIYSFEEEFSESFSLETYMYSVPEISEKYGISESKVKSVLFRMRNELRKKLKKEEFI